MHGWLSVFKPKHLSSNRVLSELKRHLPPKTKIGHAGTLDPLASGVLPVAINEATKTASMAMTQSKTYQFSVLWGVKTDSLDSEGAIIARSKKIPAVEEIRSILPLFWGDIIQVPPQYSAVKIAGKPAYHYARRGESVRLKPRHIHIFELSLLSHLGAQSHFEVRCSKGTYVRVLADDIAKTLGTVAMVSDILRTRAGPFDIKETILLDHLKEILYQRKPMTFLHPIHSVLDDIPGCQISEEQARDIKQGKAIIHGKDIEDGACVALYLNGLALVAFAVKERSFLCPKRVFNL